MVWAVAGLGNPGEQYACSRHNLGFQVVDRFASEQGIVFRKTGTLVHEGTGVLDRERVIVIKPRTFMNRSGRAVRFVLDRDQLTPGRLIVVHDDLDLPLGQIKIKQRGGHGGHRGVESVIQWCESEDFVRVRIGIGRPEPDRDAADYVLEAFSDDDLRLVETMSERGSEAIRDIVLHGVEPAMNVYNKADDAKGGETSH
jgi:PTH1 family peptidyl-tRNA hydrolase